MMALKTSIVILNYNTIDYIQTCVESIRAFTEEGHYEIIVVDNGSKDGSVEWLKEQADIKCIFNAENVGFPKGCNQGMAIATGTEIMLLNSDVIVTPRWHEQLIKALYSSEDVGAVSCITNSCSNHQQIPVPYKMVDIDELLDFAETHNNSKPSLWTMHFTLVGFCYMFRRRIYDELGDLDERFTPGNYEDDDYSFRIMKAGYKLLLCRDTFIHHYGSGSFVKKRTPVEEREHIKKYNALLERNFGYFQQKWHVRDTMYKSIGQSVVALNDYIKPNQRILIVARNRLMYICFLLSQRKNLRIDYLTDACLDYELMHYHCNIILCDDLLEGTNKLTGKYSGILLSNTISDYFNMVKLRNIISEHSDGAVIEENATSR